MSGNAAAFDCVLLGTAAFNPGVWGPNPQRPALFYQLSTLNATVIEPNSMTKKEQLLSDPNIARWYNNLARGSQHTAELLSADYQPIVN